MNCFQGTDAIRECCRRKTAITRRFTSSGAKKGAAHPPPKKPVARRLEELTDCDERNSINCRDVMTPQPEEHTAVTQKSRIRIWAEQRELNN